MYRSRGFPATPVMETRFNQFLVAFPQTMRFSRNQILGAVLLLILIWLVIAIRLIIARG
jgi:hypothetical protein